MMHFQLILNKDQLSKYERNVLTRNNLHYEGLASFPYNYYEPILLTSIVGYKIFKDTLLPALEYIAIDRRFAKIIYYYQFGKKFKNVNNSIILNSYKFRYIRSIEDIHNLSIEIKNQKEFTNPDDQIFGNLTNIKFASGFTKYAASGLDNHMLYLSDHIFKYGIAIIGYIITIYKYEDMAYRKPNVFLLSIQDLKGFIYKNKSTGVINKPTFINYVQTPLL